MIYFTADHHFGHANIIRHCNRPFQNVEEMDMALLSNWNASVKPQDTVYILGDLFFRNATAIAEYLQKLTAFRDACTKAVGSAEMKICV